jgi:lipoprotein-releasing system permease protein
VDNNWFLVSGLDSFLLKGTAHWPVQKGFTPVILGLSIANSLSVDVDNAFSGLNIYYPHSGAGMLQDPQSALNRTIAKPQGLFHIQEEFDGKYVLIPLPDAQQLFERPGSISAIEIKKTTTASEPELKKSIETSLGPGFIVASRYEQNKTLFMVLRSEKWAVYAILLLVLLIASFNMIGSLSMLVLEKKKDITILKSMGAGKGTIRMIFLCEGWLLAFVGALIGISLGALICLGQQYFGWVGLPDGFVVHAYPVAFQFPDFLLVLITALVVGLLAAWYPSRKAAAQPVQLRAE